MIKPDQAHIRNFDEIQQDIEAHPEKAKLRPLLVSGLREQLELVEAGVGIHATRCIDAMRPLHEHMAADEAGVPIVPVFSSEHYTRNSILALMKLRDDPEKGEAVKVCFKENLVDVNLVATLPPSYPIIGPLVELSCGKA